MPYLSLRPVRWLAWLSVAGWKLYRDRLGAWYVVHPATRRVRPLRSSALLDPARLRARTRWENDEADTRAAWPPRTGGRGSRQEEAPPTRDR